MSSRDSSTDVDLLRVPTTPADTEALDRLRITPAPDADGYAAFLGTLRSPPYAVLRDRDGPARGVPFSLST